MCKIGVSIPFIGVALPFIGVDEGKVRFCPPFDPYSTNGLHVYHGNLLTIGWPKMQLLQALGCGD